MYCQYRMVARCEDGGGTSVAVHEVYFKLNGEISGISEFPVPLEWDDPVEAAGELAALAEAMEDDEVLDYDAYPKFDGDTGGIVVVYSRDPPEDLPSPNAYPCITYLS